jgi:hypothetical protein
MEIILTSTVPWQSVAVVVADPARPSKTMDATADPVAVVEVTLEGVNLASPWQIYRTLGNTRAMMVGQEPTTMVETVAVVELTVPVLVQPSRSLKVAAWACFGI